MFGKKNEKLETLKNLIGTRAGYIETVEMLELKGDEKDLFMRASLEVKKSEPNLSIIERAHAILVRKSFQGETEEGTENNINDNDNNPPPEKKKPKAFDGLQDNKSTSNRHTSHTSDTEDNTKNDINYASLNYKPQRKFYVKYLAIAILVIGAYFFMNNMPTAEEDKIESKIQKHSYSKVSYSSKKTAYETIRIDEVVKRNGLIYKKNSQESFTGIMEEYNKNGQKSFEQNIKNGKPNGRMFSWYKNGQMRMDLNFKNGKHDGKYALWYKNGLKFYESNYKNGKMDGIEVMWYKNGKKIYECNYENDRRGRQVYWDENGQQVTSSVSRSFYAMKVGDMIEKFEEMP